MGDHHGTSPPPDDRPASAAEVRELVERAGAAIGAVHVGDRLEQVEGSLAGALETMEAYTTVLEQLGARVNTLERCERTWLQVVLRTYDFDGAEGPFHLPPISEQKVLSVPLSTLAQAFDLRGVQGEMSLLGFDGNPAPIALGAGEGRFLDIIVCRPPYLVTGIEDSHQPHPEGYPGTGHVVLLDGTKPVPVDDVDKG